jgi:glutamine synthetase
MMKDYLRKHPDVRTIRVAAVDLNGQARGKRVPARFADNVVKNGTRFPFSVLNLDIWGEDIDDSPLVFEQGDADGVLKPTERGFMPMPWLEAPTALLPIWMFRENGQPYEGDPRHALRAVVERYKARGLTPVCAMELEFFLIDDSWQDPASPAVTPVGQAAEGGGNLVDPRAGRLRHLLHRPLRRLRGDGHSRRHHHLGNRAWPVRGEPDALRRRPARRRRCLAVQDAGQGACPPPRLCRQLHGQALCRIFGLGPAHAFLVLDAKGDNIFDSGGPKGTAHLRHAVAGCLRRCTIPRCFSRRISTATNGSSLTSTRPPPSPGAMKTAPPRSAFRRATRPPGGSNTAWRGDVNPYLMLAAILGAALTGIEDEMEPPPRRHRQRLCDGPAADSLQLGSRDRGVRTFATSFIASFPRN